MAEETQPTSTPPKGKAADGFSAPVAEPAEGSNLPDHIHPDTLMAKGVDPDTKEMISVNLAALKVKYGEKKGRTLYGKIAKLGGFYDPDAEAVGSSFFPDLSLDGMNPEIKAKIDAILKES